MSANADGYIKAWTTYNGVPGIGNLSFTQNGSFAYSSAFVRCSGGDSSADYGAIRCYVEHSHNYEHIHYINSDGGNESRPNNYTYKIWKRIS